MLNVISSCVMVMVVHRRPLNGCVSGGDTHISRFIHNLNTKLNTHSSVAAL